jgi:hypothetical protein
LKQLAVVRCTSLLTSLEPLRQDQKSARFDARMCDARMQQRVCIVCTFNTSKAGWLDVLRVRSYSVAYCRPELSVHTPYSLQSPPVFSLGKIPIQVNNPPFNTFFSPCRPSRLRASPRARPMDFTAKARHVSSRGSGGIWHGRQNRAEAIEEGRNSGPPLASTNAKRTSSYIRFRQQTQEMRGV